MEKASHSQLELFSDSKDSTSPGRGLSNSFLKEIWNYEKIILLFLGFTITGIISFSLGVEKGKHIAALKETVQSVTIQQPASAKEIAKPKFQQNEPTIKKEAIIDSQRYTIQVASYKTKLLAQKEAETLKGKGYSPLLLTKSGYVILCVGKFTDKQKAKSLLSELKTYYRDCLIRRL